MEIRLKIENDMAKADEIKILEKLMGAFQRHNDNYLNHCFSPEFITWASSQIRDDIMVNPMEYIQDNSKDEEIETLRYAIGTVKATDNDLRKGLKEATDRIDFLNEELKRRTQALIETVNLNIEQQDNLNVTIQECSEKLEFLENENNRLKVKLFDLMEK